ncbi:hypothetical protein B0H21DRAFT_697351 [Amylocystis lapponica]|nr:hypothetical protein B0H21DRAFT_697351 [Amylocystis lapponica]
MPHPPLSRRRSSLLSAGSSPHTPPNSNSPLPFLSSAANRKSSDSWNSSNYDGAEDIEVEWTPEHTRLLTRTLDALPAHLLTPFNGPIPPSNLLDKIARGVSQAKGPGGWPHSLRATRAKIVELARVRAREAIIEGDNDTIAEEDGIDLDVLQETTNMGPKRPLYRQSSMDFVQTSKQDLKDNSNISRLSNRLQRTDRILSSPSDHTDAHATSHSPSPPHPLATRGSFFPSTPSSTTLNSSNSGSRIPRLRRSLSSLSGSSDSYCQIAVDPRMQRVKRADSFGGQLLYGPGSLKRAPSFGATSKRSSDAMSINLSGRDSDVTSDEEEKLRSMKAKKARVKASSPSSPATSSPAISPEKRRRLQRKSSQQPLNKQAKPLKEGSARRSTRPKINLERNPSILGAELPLPHVDLEHSAALRSSPGSRNRKSPKSPNLSTSPPAKSGVIAFNLEHIPTFNPQTPQDRPLRRIKGTSVPSRPARKISFGSISVPSSEDTTCPGAGLGLGSAFQLQ